MPTQRQVSVRNGLFDITVREAGEGEPLLFLHNMALQNEWDPFLESLSERYRVIAPYHPGFQSSKGIEYVDDVIDMVVYYNDLLDALDIEKTHVLGHELGGMFAAELAALSPHRVNKLILCAAYGLWIEEAPVPDRYATPFRMLREKRWHDPSIEAAGSYEARPKDPADMQEWTVLTTRAQASGSRFLWQFPERGLHKRIHRIKAPTLVLWGESDGMVPLIYGRAFEAGIENAELVTIPEAGNLPMYEKPEEFVTAVSDFLG